jgi:ribonuclease E
MASPDESRVDEARDQSGAPASPDPTTTDPASTPRLNGGSSADEPGESVSPGRPRGTASFPGGAPPVTTAPPEVAVPVTPPTPDAPARFRVTTVEPSAASFPGGPPPKTAAPAEPRPATVSPDGATPPTPAADAPATPAADAPATATPPAPATAASAPRASAPAADAPAATPPADVDAAGGSAPPTPAVDRADGPGAAGPVVDRAGEAGAAGPVVDRADEAGAVTPVVDRTGGSATPAPAVGEPERAGAEAEVAESGGGRTGGRRRRRGRGGRAAATVAPGAEASGPEAAAPDATRPTAAEAAEATAAPATSGRQGIGAAGRAPEAAAAPDGDGAEARDAAEGPDAAPAPDGAGGRDAVTVSPAGSARTRARRRRRAAAKVRGREVGTATSVDEPAAAPATRRARPDDQPAGETTTHADEQPTGRRGRRAAPAADLPADATQGPDEAAPAARAGSRTSRRGARAAAPEPAAADGEPAAEPRAARAAEPQPGRGANREPIGTAGERGGGRTRRRGRGRPAAAKDDTATASAPEAAPARPAAERSTRLETRGRGRQGDRGRRRPRGLTEEQKRVLREEGPDKRMLVTEGAERTQIGVLEGQTLVEHYVTRKAGRSMVGNIYLGRVQNVLPGMEAAFIDIGRGRNAVLYAGEVNYSEEDLDGEAPRIERVLKAGQPVLVQVTKDPIGAKGARLTAQVSLAGRYLVLQPEDNTFGISRRLPEEERSRLRDILKEVRPKGLGLIVRTAAEGASADDLRADLARLQARWEGVERKAKKASAPAVIYSEPELVVRVIRDIFSPDFAELVVDDDDLYQRVHEYLQEVAPDLLPKLRRHDGALPLFEDYQVVEQIHKALERKVWLPSGGSIVIDRTEAMTVIDVNTGKFVGRANLEETVVANNLEAADEVVRQLRLRDIGGIIIIDFIDMLFERNQQAVVDRLRDALTRDKTKSQVMEVSSLGLVQMTRKRVSGGLLDSFSETCPTCDGRGVVITHEIQ